MNIPKINKNICLMPDVWKRWGKLLAEENMIYLYAMTGFGKTTQVLAFAKQAYKKCLYISAADEQFMDKFKMAAEAEDGEKEKTLLIMDDMQWIFDQVQQQTVFEMLLTLRKKHKYHMFLISRASVPAYLMPFQVTRQMVVEGQETLLLNENLARELLMMYPELAALTELNKKKIIEAYIEPTLGCALGINAFYLRLSKNPTDYKTAAALAVQDIYDYLAIHLFGEWTKERCDEAISLSVYEDFDTEMAKALLGEETKKVLADFKSVGSFLNFKAPDTYMFVPFFRDFLLNQLAKRPKAERQKVYDLAAECYEKRRDFEQALRCYKSAERQDRIAEIVIYLSENAEGCAFAKIAQNYIEELPEEWEQKEPRILGAKVMLAAYQMHPEECMQLLAELKQMADDERGCVMKGNAMRTYVRTAIACPYDTADTLKDNMLYYMDYVRHNGFGLNNIMPTGNMPSLINGGLDLLPWVKNKTMLYPIIKAAAELIMGKEAIGIADASMGEALYEQNKSSKALGYLTKALSAANYNGSIRVQYAVTGIMARMFQSEGQSDTAEEILQNILQKVEQVHFNELLPNLNATLVNCALLTGDAVRLEEWINESAPDEHQQFFITIRYQLFIKARVYTTLGKTMEALYILNLLEEFAILYERTYLHMEVLILKAIILFRREEEWQEPLLTAVKMVQPYGFVRLFADQGAALFPLWKQIDWEQQDIPVEKCKVITKEMKKMAVYYPNYMKVPHRYGELSKKEKEVIVLMAEGCNNSKIAQMLGVNLGTVKFHVANIMKKLEAENRTVAVKVAQEEGLL